jgi:UDP-N-acetylglucosamine--N-acetylmuramyl-(pentapeptide) pyrophosphoryl-undecaprenol N-acetylglucosamine transferase
MAGAYAWADFVIARSGAGTVSELAAVGIPALFVPFAAAADDHQTANARPLAETGAALSVPELGWDGATVGEALREVLEDAARLREMAAAMRRWGRRDALTHLADEVVALAGGASAPAGRR